MNSNKLPQTRECASDSFAIPVEPEFFDKHAWQLPRELPFGYGYKGGVARSALLWQQGHDVPIRDIDLVAIGSGHDKTQADALAAEYMPRDFAYGDGVEIIEDIQEYFNSRDFTINEVLLIDGVLHASTAATDAAEHRVIKGTDYELEQFDNRLGPKLALKALLLKVILEDSTGMDWTVEDIRDTYYTDFYIALAMNKALMMGEQIANKFLRLLQSRRMVSQEYTLKSLLEEMTCFFEYDTKLWPDDPFDVDNTEYYAYSGYEVAAEQRYYGTRMSEMH